MSRFLWQWCTRCSSRLQQDTSLQASWAVAFWCFLGLGAGEGGWRQAKSKIIAWISVEIALQFPVKGFFFSFFQKNTQKNNTTLQKNNPTNIRSYQYSEVFGFLLNDHNCSDFLELRAGLSDRRAWERQPCNTHPALQNQTVWTDPSTAAAVWIRRNQPAFNTAECLLSTVHSEALGRGQLLRPEEAAPAWRVFEGAAEKIPLMKRIEEALVSRFTHLHAHTHRIYYVSASFCLLKYVV